MSRLFRTSDVSRERNRVHAQRTRQRKKEQMQGLQGQVSILKDEQLRLRQAINEQNTANILVGILACNASVLTNGAATTSEDPKVEELLRRPIEEIPDASQIPELPALILPGSQASKKPKDGSNNGQELMGLEGIDLELLERKRTDCTPQELDKIRRERNRMHAKRTRDRKRLFTEKLSDISRTLAEENALLRSHLATIDPDNSLITSSPYETSGSDASCTDSVPLKGLTSVSGLVSTDGSPRYDPTDVTGAEISPLSLASTLSFANSRKEEENGDDGGTERTSSTSSNFGLSTLLQAAVGFLEGLPPRPLARAPEASIVSVSGNYDSSSESSDRYSHDSSDEPWPKRSRLSGDVPYSRVARGGS